MMHNIVNVHFLICLILIFSPQLFMHCCCFFCWGINEYRAKILFPGHCENYTQLKITVAPPPGPSSFCISTPQPDQALAGRARNMAARPANLGQLRCWTQAGTIIIIRGFFEVRLLFEFYWRFYLQSTLYTWRVFIIICILWQFVQMKFEKTPQDKCTI